MPVIKETFQCPDMNNLKYDADPPITSFSRCLSFTSGTLGVLFALDY